MPREENIKSIFYADVREKKSAGTGIYHKRNGSKTRYVSLPSDHMTRKEWTRMNGEIKDYRLGEPLSWESFKALPSDLKYTYIESLVIRFGVTKTAFAEVLGVSVSGFTKCTKDLNLTKLFHAGSKMKKDQKAAFYEFYGVEFKEEDHAPVEDVVPEVAVCECDTEVAEPVETSTEFPTESNTECNTPSKLSMREFAIEFCGGFDADHVANSLRYIIPAGTSVRVKISCEVQGV